jgi:hypothetical protein
LSCFVAQQDEDSDKHKCRLLTRLENCSFCGFSETSETRCHIPEDRRLVTSAPGTLPWRYKARFPKTAHLMMQTKRRFLSQSPPPPPTHSLQQAPQDGWNQREGCFIRSPLSLFCVTQLRLRLTASRRLKVDGQFGNYCSVWSGCTALNPQFRYTACRAVTAPLLLAATTAAACGKNC